MVVETEQQWLGNEPQTWAAQAMPLPVDWYESIVRYTDVGYEMSGDATMKAKANPPMFFARGRIAHGSRPLPLRA